MLKKVNIVIFGDSITSCSHLKKKNRWVEILKKNFKNEKKNTLVNFKSFSYYGATSNDALNKVKFVLKTKKVDILIIMFGINDSVYWMSKMGKPRVSLKKFKYNIKKIIEKFKKKYKTQLIFLTSHKFLQNRKEGNGKTHNYNYIKYRKEIFKTTKNFKCLKIDIYNELKNYNSKKYCLPLPDGLHLNNFGSLMYSKIISRFIIKNIL